MQSSEFAAGFAPVWHGSPDVPITAAVDDSFSFDAALDTACLPDGGAVPRDLSPTRRTEIETPDAGGNGFAWAFPARTDLHSRGFRPEFTFSHSDDPRGTPG